MLDGLTSFLTAYVGQAVAYGLLAGGLFLLVHRWGARRLTSRRIAVRGKRLDGDQLRHEARHTLVVLGIGTAQLIAVSALRDAGLASLPETVVSLPTAAAAFLALIALNDLWFYAVHRALHTPWLFKHVHAVHHRSVDVNPLSSYSFHVVEAALLTGWLLPLALVVPLPLPVLTAAQGAGLANNLMAHLGYELLPAWWTRVPVLRWSNSATFHSQHHTRYKGNFGLFTRVWDRLLGTDLPGYEAAFAAAHAATSTAEPDSARA